MSEAAGELRLERLLADALRPIEPPEDLASRVNATLGTIAEQAAWDLVRERGEEDRLAVVNPGAIVGPVLNDDLSYSLQAVQRLLEGTPGFPKLGFGLVDVRDRRQT